MTTAWYGLGVRREEGRAFFVIALAGYWFSQRGGNGCGSDGAVACPELALEEGAGTTLSADDVCPAAGYLCANRQERQ
jgi:hypothetical protein